MTKIHDITTRRAYLEELTNVARVVDVCFHPADIFFFEGYSGELEDKINSELTIIHFYGNESICVTKDFKEIKKRVFAYREEAKRNSIFKKN